MERTTRLQAPAPPPVHSSLSGGLQGSDAKMQKEMEDASHAFAGLVGIALLVPIVMGGITVILFAFWLWMLIAVVTKEPEGTDKIVWTIVVVFTGPVGALIYFFARFLSKSSARYAH